MIAAIDNALNRVTMYRLTLYYLIGLLGVAVALSSAGFLPYDPYALLFTIGFEIAACWATNLIFAKAFGAPTNAESFYISALILALIITPIQSIHEIGFLVWSAVWAMASKYILAINKKHLFNPAAFAVALTALTINQTASWWVGSAPMLPFVLIGGLLLVRKLRRRALVTSFVLTALATILLFSLASGEGMLAALQQTVLYSPLLFLAFVILTEPLTTPPTRRLQILYGALVGLLFSPQFHIGGFYTTPELAIVIGNIFSYLVSPKAKLLLVLKEKLQIGPDIYEFVFAPARPLAFAPGQYMEWTLAHRAPDSRGNRRYFTLASSPTEPELRLGVKFYRSSSTFKQALLGLGPEGEIVAAQLAGDFVLPDDPAQKCVFIAGGIGITPFRSMLKYLLDTRQPRPIVLFYSNRSADDIVYGDVLERAERELGVRTIHMVTDPSKLPAGREGRAGYVTPQLIQEVIPDYTSCMFYISGRAEMVEAYRAMLIGMQIKSSQIKTDRFSGLA